MNEITSGEMARVIGLRLQQILQFTTKPIQTKSQFNVKMNKQAYGNTEKKATKILHQKLFLHIWANKISINHRQLYFERPL